MNFALTIKGTVAIFRGDSNNALQKKSKRKSNHRDKWVAVYLHPVLHICQRYPLKRKKAYDFESRIIAQHN